LHLGTNFASNGENFGFSGTIPASIAKISQLERLELNDNRLTGELPIELGNLTNLKVYDISGNSGLEGSIPTEYANMVALDEFYISKTGIQSQVPNSWCQSEVFVEISCVNQNSAVQCSCCECAQ
jgi:hypothetical protein